MKKSIYWLFIIVVVLISKSASGEWQYWSHYEVVGSVSGNLDFKVKPEIRYDDNFRHHYYTHFDIGFDWELTDWFILAPYYRHINEKQNESWEIEYRPHLNATFKWRFLSYFNLSDRSRIEFRIKEKKALRYRNKLTVKMSEFTRFEIQPRIEEEFFCDFDKSEFNKNRVYAGIDFKAIENLKIGLYFILEGIKREGTWTTLNILQSSLKYGF
jgi:hypothetical protein